MSEMQLTDNIFICIDCNVDTLKIHEYYYVNNALWKLHGARNRMLCIGCLEQRISRCLVPSDFTQAKINTPEQSLLKFFSQRFLSRLQWSVPIEAK